MHVTCHVIHGFETKTEAANFHGILRFDAVAQPLNPVPIFLREFGIVVGIESWTLCVREMQFW